MKAGLSAEFGLSITEIGAMDVFDFYVWVVEYEKRIDKRVSSADKD